MNSSSLPRFFSDVFWLVQAPKFWMLWSQASQFDSHHSFIVRYTAAEDLGLDMHTDDSVTWIGEKNQNWNIYINIYIYSLFQCVTADIFNLQLWSFGIKRKSAAQDITFNVCLGVDLMPRIWKISPGWHVAKRFRLWLYRGHLDILRLHGFGRPPEGHLLRLLVKQNW